MGIKRQHTEVEHGEDDDNEIEEDEDILANLSAAHQREVTGEPAKKLTKKEREKLYKEPTVEELKQMKETENLFHSNLFRLQISEVLKEVTLKDKHKKYAHNLIDNLKEMILDIPASEQIRLTDTQWFLKQKVKVPIYQPDDDNKGQFQYLPPSSICVVGSYSTNTVVKPHSVIDLLVEMPKGCISEKDNFNHRLFRKRALYLTYVAAKLNKTTLCQAMKFTYQHGNHLKPILNLNVQGRSINVNIIVCLPHNTYKLETFNVNICNINVKWYKEITQAESKDDVRLKPTPYSNMAILEDLTQKTNTEYIENILADLPAFQDGIKLLKIWLRQRELDMGYGYFSSYIMTMYVMYLLSQRLLNKMMSSYQVFRSTLIYLARNDWCVKAPSLFKIKKSLNEKSSEFNMKSVFDVVFLDVTGHYNLAYTLNKAVYQRVLHEAKLSADYFTTKPNDAFDLLLMTSVAFDRKFDYCFHVDNLKSIQEHGDTLGGLDKLIDNGGNYVYAYLTSILDVLEKALDKRILLIQPRSLPTPTWNIDEDCSNYNDINCITIGLLVDTFMSTKSVEKGPTADSSEAREFREFWGEVSELRRFQDGSICEAIVWSKGSTFRKKRLVISKIIPYVLKKYAGIDLEDIRYMGEEFDVPLHIPFPKQIDQPIYGTGEEQHMSVIHTFDGIKKSLRGLSDMPLRINNIQGIHPVFRFTDVFPVMALNQFKETKKVNDHYYPTRSLVAPAYQPTLPVTCILEGSGKWPDDIEAVKRLKAAIYIKISKDLSLDKSLKVILQPTHIDIFKNGFVFRIKIYALRELSIMKAFVTKTGVLSVQNNQKSFQFEKDVIALPKLSSTIHGIYQQHNTMCSAVRLAKRWTSAQLLSNHVPDIVIELIVCYIYLSPAPYTKPGSPGSAFLRFLQLLSSFDWRNYPLMVDLNTEFTAEDLVDIPARFNKEREKFPLMFISTPMDKWSSYWTKDQPSAMILNRLALLAKESLHVLQTQVLQPQSNDDIKEVFRPPLDSYDVVIYLQANQVPRYYQSIDYPKDKPIPTLRSTDDQIFPVIDFDPVVKYVKELEEIYADRALFFYDQYGGTCIGVLWKPRLFQKRDFKVPNLLMSKPSTRGSEIVLEFNLQAVLEDFKVLGTNLVDKVEVKTQPKTDV
ncbi:hypothetical protein LOTGIDRAFT_220490 [Lottia gigantea]|uniref:Nucleolar protein 6 n=1 Tax=Lottia gigantea TaxID=225164 RepID=V3Z767_LOTGI|nr:hypothetical protein LOTGIDRAFT_220490 [Lottia gigantea]ESO86693.1 hypothetical protein LOTGIDRAFT_220490 [Lottia gigantea]